MTRIYLRTQLDMEKMKLVQTIALNFSSQHTIVSPLTFPRCRIVVMVVHELHQCLSCVSLGVKAVGVLTAFFFSPLLATSSRENVLLVIKVPVFIFIKMRLHACIYSRNDEICLNPLKYIVSELISLCLFTKSIFLSQRKTDVEYDWLIYSHDHDVIS